MTKNQDREYHWQQCGGGRNGLQTKRAQIETASLEGATIAVHVNTSSNNQHVYLLNIK